MQNSILLYTKQTLNLKMPDDTFRSAPIHISTFLPTLFSLWSFLHSPHATATLQRCSTETTLVTSQYIILHYYAHVNCTESYIS